MDAQGSSGMNVSASPLKTNLGYSNDSSSMFWDFYVGAVCLKYWYPVLYSMICSLIYTYYIIIAYLLKKFFLNLCMEFRQRE